jgi:hypothetical protein
MSIQILRLSRSQAPCPSCSRASQATYSTWSRSYEDAVGGPVVVGVGGNYMVAARQRDLVGGVRRGDFFGAGVELHNPAARRAAPSGI